MQACQLELLRQHNQHSYLSGMGTVVLPTCPEINQSLDPQIELLLLDQ